MYEFKINLCCTCREVFIDGPVIHLQCSITTIPGEADHMIFPIIHWDTALLHTDIHSANVECHSNFALLLKKKQKNNTKILDTVGVFKAFWLFSLNPFVCAWKPSAPHYHFLYGILHWLMCVMTLLMSVWKSDVFCIKCISFILVKALKRALCSWERLSAV